MKVAVVLALSCVVLALAQDDLSNIKLVKLPADMIEEHMATVPEARDDVKPEVPEPDQMQRRGGGGGKGKGESAPPPAPGWGWGPPPMPMGWGGAPMGAPMGGYGGMGGYGR